MNQQFSIGIIADDFTGAMDTGAQFARFALDTSFAVSSIPYDQVVILNTNSRELTPNEARTRCMDAIQRLRGRRLFKKIDSTLRGHIAAELGALLSEFPYKKILICPATPQQGRIVKDGILYINGVPLHESAFKNDPAFPARTSAIGELVGVPSTHLTLDKVRCPVNELIARIACAPTQVITSDAITSEDLLHLSQAILINNYLPCGAYGLAIAWAQTLTGRNGKNDFVAVPRKKTPALIVAGSANSRTHAQIKALKSHSESLICKINVPLNPVEKENLIITLQKNWNNYRVIVLCPELQTSTDDPEWLTFSQTVSRLAREFLQNNQPGYMIIAGGETANHLCGLLKVEAVQLLGEVAPGIPIGKLLGGLADQLTLVTKAGGFGQADCLEKIVYT